MLNKATKTSTTHVFLDTTNNIFSLNREGFIK